MRLLMMIVFCVLWISSAWAQFGKAAHFFGGSGYISVPTDSSLRVTKAITMEAWVKFDSLHSGQIGIAGTWDDIAGSNRTWFLWVLSNSFEFLVSSNGSSIGRARGQQVAKDRWYHLAGTFDGDSIRLYVDDTLRARVNYPATIHTNMFPLYIGRTETGSNGSDYLFGWIDELRIWNRARALPQLIRTAHDTLDARYYDSEDSGLVAYYRFDETGDFGVGDSSSPDIFDRSIEQNHGDIAGRVEFDVSDIPVAAIDHGESLTDPHGFELAQNYPNPFNPVTEIRYALPAAGNVTLTVINLLGQQVKTLVTKYQYAGQYTVRWNGMSDTGIAVASGIYLYRLSVAGHMKTKKMLLVR
jgi:hypothetical protein